MLGVCLLFVGIVLINNGACALWKVSPKAAAVMTINLNTLIGYKKNGERHHFLDEY